MKKLHNWVTLENPNNGKVQMRACTDCGAMKLSSTQIVSDCKAIVMPVPSLDVNKQTSLEV